MATNLKKLITGTPNLDVSSFVGSPTVPTALTSVNTTPTQGITIPTPKPDYTNYQGIVEGAQTQTDAIQKQIDEMVKQATEAPQKEATSSGPMDAIKAMLNSYSQTTPPVQGEAPVAQDQLNNVNATAQVTQQAKAKLGNISAQLQALNTEAQAIPIKAQQDATGRGITDAGLAPIQSAQLRDNALKALPLQAQAAVASAEVAAAQGNQQLAQDLYTQAQSHLDKAYQIQYENDKNQFDYNISIIDKAYQFADKADQRQFDAMKLQDQQDFQVQQAERANQYEQQRDKVLYQQDIAKIQYQNSLKDTGVKTQVVDVNGKKVLINSDTGEVINNIGGGDSSSSVQQLAQAKGNIDLISELTSNGALGSAVGPNSFARFSPLASINGTKSNFIAGVEQLTSQLSLNSLINAKAQGATFGALSEGELKLLSASASKLNSWAKPDPKTGQIIGYNAKESDFKAELDKINNFAKLDYILKGGSPADVEAVQQPNGKYLVKNSDGTYTEL